MNNKEIVKDAIEATYIKYGIGQAVGAVESLLNNKCSNYFTNDMKVREKLNDLGLEQAKKTVIQEYLVYALTCHYPNELEQAIKNTYYKYSREKDVPHARMLLERCIKDCIEKGDNHFTRDFRSRENLNANINRDGKNVQQYVIEQIAANVTMNVINERQEEKGSLQNRPSNVQIHRENMEACRSAILNGMGIEHETSATIGNSLQAYSSIGNIRKNQEDAALIIKHPTIPEFKMLVVADGVGGLENGEYASNKVVEEIKNWFSNLDPSYYTNQDDLEEHFRQVLQIISDEIYQEKDGEAGSTFVGAIVCKDTTLVSNVGDSRAYMLTSKNQLVQITEDQSLANQYYQQGRIQSRDHMRFHRESNIILQNLGDGRTMKPNFYSVKNQDYNSILCVSDGVTDCLSDLDILAITKYTNRKDLARVLVEKASITDSKRPDELNPNEYLSDIFGGKDNTTAAVYNKEDDEDRGGR